LISWAKEETPEREREHDRLDDQFAAAEERWQAANCELVNLELQGREITAGEIEAAKEQAGILRTVGTAAYNEYREACDNLQEKLKVRARAGEIQAAEEKVVNLGVEAIGAHIQWWESDNKLQALPQRETTPPPAAPTESIESIAHRT
jgi:DhnA family fructose-bisphosphate aldolase class Ia